MSIITQPRFHIDFDTMHEVHPGCLKDADNVKHQYAGDRNLSARLRLHEKHSTNKLGFFPWLHGLYRFTENAVILEVGCGNAMQWKGKIGTIPPGGSLTLSDYSEGMLAAAKQNLAHHPTNITFCQADIQDLPFDDHSFGTVIANHMLYHVPDIDKALAEVQRVLIPGGRFYAATNSNGGLRPFLHNAIKNFEPGTDAFTQTLLFNMENGGEILRRHFSSIKRHDYADSLAITETQDLMDWLESSMSMTGYNSQLQDKLYEYFEKIRVAEGAINIPKQACLFDCAE